MLDLPVYPSVEGATVTRSNDGDVVTVTLAATTTDPYESVALWYAGHLENEFVRARSQNASGQPSITFSDRDPDDNTPATERRVVSLESATGAANQPVVVISLTTIETAGDNARTNAEPTQPARD
jgi:hypothetical protein